MADGAVVGWDIGGAHVKAAWLDGARLHDAVQWPCPLWQGLDTLSAVFEQAHRRWPALGGAAHAVTMTGEMVDHFAHREDGVGRIAALAGRALPRPHFFAGDTGWCTAADAGPRWADIASANWLATAHHVARMLPQAAGVLVDIGSTTTDLIAFQRGRVRVASRRDADRLARGELVYQGVVRTPLCALGPRIVWRGVPHNVMNEFFATTADVYRLTGELDPAHDQHPAADGGTKDAAGSRARLARMVGLDARDGSIADWLAFAHGWRAAQVDELRGQLDRVARDQDFGPDAVVVAAGCGAFLAPEIAPAGWRVLRYGTEVAHAGTALAGWADVAAPSVAVAALWQRESR